MPYPTTEQWIETALTGDDGVWQIGQIGQIDKPTERALNKLVRKGKLCKARGRFMGISNPKTIWHRPGLGFNIIECPRTEAHHDDYSKPLEVRWLCKKHHVEIHYGK